MTGNYTVSKDGDDWVARRDDASRASSRHATQAGAIDAAKGYSRNAGGGEVTIKRPDGEIRAKDTVPHGNDPHPPKG